MDFGVICVEVSRKFSKNPQFGKKVFLHSDENFPKYFYRGALTPPPKNNPGAHQMSSWYPPAPAAAPPPPPFVEASAWPKNRRFLKSFSQIIKNRV